MIVAFLPGFTRSAADHAHWPDLLPGHDVRLCELPGHGPKPGIANSTISRLADHFAAEIPPGALIVGESLGGLIGLAMAPRGYHLAAFDPPLSTAKLWMMRVSVPPVVARYPEMKWLPSFVDNLLGVTADGMLEERNSWPLLDALTGPVDIIGGTEPLWPVRAVAGTPSVIDDIDEFHLKRHPKVRFRRVEGTHLMLSENPQGCQAALLEILAKLERRAP